MTPLHNPEIVVGRTVWLDQYRAPKIEGWIHFANSTAEDIAEVKADYRKAFSGHQKMIVAFEAPPFHFAIYYKIEKMKEGEAEWIS